VKSSDQCVALARLCSDQNLTLRFAKTYGVNLSCLVNFSGEKVNANVDHAFATLVTMESTANAATLGVRQAVPENVEVCCLAGDFD